MNPSRTPRGFNRAQANARARAIMQESPSASCKVHSNGPGHSYVVHVTHRQDKDGCYPAGPRTVTA